MMENKRREYTSDLRGNKALIYLLTFEKGTVMGHSTLRPLGRPGPQIPQNRNKL